jgi:rubrerythrin
VTTEERNTAADAWSFRARVEREAAVRFGRLAAAITAFDENSPVPALMRRAAEDERRHAALCAELAAAYGSSEAGNAEDIAIAPRNLGPRAAVLYEVVAACCITETESVATLTTLLGEELEPRVEEVVREIAKDEVSHGRMGWAHLAREATAYDVSFLAPMIPAMLSGAVDHALFVGGDAPSGSSNLVRHGVLPDSRKREIFVRTLEEVVVPGLETARIDPGPTRTWVASRQRTG